VSLVREAAGGRWRSVRREKKGNILKVPYELQFLDAPADPGLFE